ncbi:MAG: hypothetical protein AB7E47_12925 [Desulfovibrionaceae bacterium]
MDWIKCVSVRDRTRRAWAREVQYPSHIPVPGSAVMYLLEPGQWIVLDFEMIEWTVMSVADFNDLYIPEHPDLPVPAAVQQIFDDMPSYLDWKLDVEAAA